jgi:hypothetical protein
MRNALILAAMGMMGLLAGCLETETVLAPPEQGAVDAKLVGDWKIAGDEGRTTEITVRNFDGHQFYVEMREPTPETTRYAAHVAVIKGASFVHLRPLTDDGTIERKYVLMRFDRADDNKVNLRHLKEDFFADKPHETSQKLRAIIEQNVENPLCTTAIRSR